MNTTDSPLVEAQKQADRASNWVASFESMLNKPGQLFIPVTIQVETAKVLHGLSVLHFLDAEQSNGKWRVMVVTHTVSYAGPDGTQHNVGQSRRPWHEASLVEKVNSIEGLERLKRALEESKPVLSRRMSSNTSILENLLKNQ